MNFFRAVYNWFSRRESTPVTASDSDIISPRTGYSYDYLTFLGSTDPGLCIATVYRCVKLLSESVAQLPLQYMRLKDGIFQEDVNSRLHYLLTVQPDYAYNAFDFWQQVIVNVLLDGNAYIIPVYNTVSMDIERLVLCGRNTVSHDTENDTYTVFDETNNICGTYDESEVIHIKGMGHRNPKHGLSVISYAAITLSIAQTGDKETHSRFSNGGNVRGIVGNDKSVRGFGEYQDQELSKTAKDLDTRFQRGERIVSLPGVVDFKQISLSSTDMQFLESRKFTVREICRFFGVHPSFVFDDTSNNYKSAEMANVAFLSTTLNPILRKAEIELHRKLVPATLCCKRKFIFDRKGLTACDLDGKAKFYTQMLATGLYTVNELRKEENKPAVDGGDRVFVSANLRGVDEPTSGARPINDNNSVKEPKGKDDGEE